MWHVAELGDSVYYLNTSPLMKKVLIFATTNPAKVSQIAGILRDLPITVQGIDPGTPLPKVEETGETPVENAIIKATTYARALETTVLSMDVGLYIDGLPANQQPGVHVRRIPGGSERPSDIEVLDYYVALVHKLGTENATGRWDFGFSLASPDGTHVETVVPSVRIFSIEVSSVIEEGYPLESIQLDPETKRYVSEMSDEEKADYWQRMMGTKLSEFIQKNFLQD